MNESSDLKREKLSLKHIFQLSNLNIMKLIHSKFQINLALIDALNGDLRFATMLQLNHKGTQKRAMGSVAK